MTTPQPYGDPQQQPYPPQQYPPQQYPQQQYQQPYPQQSYPQQQYGPQQPPAKSKMPMMIGIIVAVIVIIVVLLLLFLVILKPGTQAMTATQIWDDYQVFEGYKSFNSGDTITLRDTIDDLYNSSGILMITFKYTGSDTFLQATDITLFVDGNIGTCKEGDTITLTATVKSMAGYEIMPSGLDWTISDTSSCTA